MIKKLLFLFLICNPLNADPILWSRIPVFNRIFDTSIERQLKFLEANPNLGREHYICFIKNLMKDPRYCKTVYINTLINLLIGRYSVKALCQDAEKSMDHAVELLSDLVKRIKAYKKGEEAETHIGHHAANLAKYAALTTIWGCITYISLKYALTGSYIIGVDWYYS